MSASSSGFVTTEAPQKTSWSERFSIAQAIIAAIISLASVLLTLGVFYGSMLHRLSSVETDNGKQEAAIERNRNERDARLDSKVDKSVYQSDQDAVKATLQRIDQTVQQIREDQIEDLKERARQNHPRR